MNKEKNINLPGKSNLRVRILGIWFFINACFSIFGVISLGILLFFLLTYRDYGFNVVIFIIDIILLGLSVFYTNVLFRIKNSLYRLEKNGYISALILFAIYIGTAVVYSILKIIFIKQEWWSIVLSVIAFALIVWFVYLLQSEKNSFVQTNPAEKKLLLKVIVTNALFLIIASYFLYQIIDNSKYDKYFIEGKKYNYEITNPAAVNGKLAFTLYRIKGDTHDYVAVYDDKELGVFDAQDFTAINGKLAYSMYSDKNKGWSVIYDGKEYEKLKILSGFSTKVFGYNGQLCWPVDNNDSSYIECNGTQITPSFDGKLYDPMVINGKLAFSNFKQEINRSNKIEEQIVTKARVYFDGQESEEYEDFGNIIPVGIYNDNGKLAYAAKKNGSWIIFYDGSVIIPSSNYIAIHSPIISVNGKIAYIAEIAGYKEFIVYGDQELGKEYDDIGLLSLFALDNKIGYVARKNEKDFIVYDGKKVGKEYDSIDMDSYGQNIINNKLCFRAKAGTEEFIVYDGKELGKNYDEITSLCLNLNGKLAYFVRKNGKDFAVIEK